MERTMKTKHRLTFTINTDADPAMILDALEQAAWVVMEYFVDQGEPINFDEDSLTTEVVPPKD